MSRRKPLDNQELVQTVTSRSLHREAVKRFGAHVPQLRRLLRSAWLSREEMLLRNELRRVVGELGAVLETAARAEPDTLVASELTLLADAAREMAKTPLGASRRHH